MLPIRKQNSTEFRPPAARFAKRVKHNNLDVERRVINSDLKTNIAVKDQKISEKISSDDGRLRRFLTAAESVVKGLSYISETDAPLVPFAAAVSGRPSRKVIRELFDIKEGVAAEQTSFAEFFDRLTAIKDWFGEEDELRAERFEALRTFLTDELQELRIYRFGTVKIDIFIIGSLKDGSGIAGVRTRAIET